MKKNINVIIFYLVVFALIIFIATQMLGGQNAEACTYREVEDFFEADLVKKFEVKNTYKMLLEVYVPDDSVEGGLIRDESGKITNKTQVYSFQLSGLSLYKFDRNVDIYTQNANLEEYNFEPEQTLPWWVSFLPIIIIVIALVALWFFAMNQASGGKGGKMNSFGKARVKMPNPNDKDKITFKDVAGADEEKQELEEIVEYLKAPAKFSRLGAKIPHGVLLVGPPGTGKTLLAKAVAGEAGVPFFSISGSDFVEMYVGVGASRVRDLFENARKSPASIIFIDEIDAVGRHRGAGLGGGHDEREQTLNQLLVEMDGFGSHDGIIVMAATNRPDILDPALLRPGRFDRQVTIGYPDIRGREEILKVHARNKPFESTVDFAKIAQMTVGFTGADLANLLNEASLLAARRNKDLIGMDEIEDSFMKMLLGPKKKNRVRSEHDNKLCAYHEAGHAVASFYCEHTDPVKVVTIIPAGGAGGVTVSVPTEDTMCRSRNQMYENIVMSLGGRVAEELIMDDISTGASGDIQQATKTARNMVTRYGMSEKLGTVLYGSEHSSSEVFLGRDFSSGQNYSEKTAAEIDDEIRTLIDKAYKKCRDILVEHIDKLHFVAGFLLKNETMDGDQFKAAMEQDDITYEQLEQMAEEKRRRSREDNERRRRELEAKARAEAEAQANREADADISRDGEDIQPEGRSGNNDDIPPEGK
ncbi:MAG: ATP-dependent zinc metalloprotease FtsH [Clostridia bacterium]|nr:ATP-dependent zinc metalloprotease FtsH [Clostridia bacterium]